eukprot:352294-Chlamydomonas_euryale.AAC.2
MANSAELSLDAVWTAVWMCMVAAATAPATRGASKMLGMARTEFTLSKHVRSDSYTHIGCRFCTSSTGAYAQRVYVLAYTECYLRAVVPTSQPGGQLVCARGINRINKPEAIEAARARGVLLVGSTLDLDGDLEACELSRQLPPFLRHCQRQHRHRLHSLAPTAAAQRLTVHVQRTRPAEKHRGAPASALLQTARRSGGERARVRAAPRPLCCRRRACLSRPLSLLRSHSCALSLLRSAPGGRGRCSPCPDGGSRPPRCPSDDDDPPGAEPRAAMPILCFGPVCIPMNLLLPFLLGLAHQYGEAGLCVAGGGLGCLLAGRCGDVWRMDHGR